MESNPTVPVLLGEAARILGVSAQTVRIWERTGKLKPWHKTRAGWRIYDRGEVERLALARKVAGKCV